MKKFWLIFGGIACFVIVVVAVCLSIIFSDPKNNNNNNIVPPQIITPQIYAQDIFVYTNQSKDIIYSVDCEKDYTVCYSCNFRQVQISKNKVCVSQSGEYNFDIIVCVDGTNYTKNVKVFAYNQITDITYKIYDKNNNIVDKLFVGNSYCLKITPNSKIFDGEISLSENLSNITFEKSQTEIVANFKVESYGQTKFTLSCFEFLCEQNIDTYLYIDNFNVNIDSTNLYLFNKEFLTLANLDNKFDFTNFDYSIDDKCFSSYLITISNPDVIKIENDKIIAISSGESYINFLATDGSEYSERYKITVQNVLADTITFDEDSVELNVNQSYTPSFAISPAYAICDLSYNLNFDTSVSFDTAGTYTLTLTDSYTNKNCQMTIIVKEVVTISYELLFRNSFLTDYSATYENNTLTLVGKDTTQIHFNYNIVCSNGSDYTGSILSNAQIVNANFEYDLQVVSNSIDIVTSYKGSFDLLLSLVDNPSVTYTLHIVIE